jgi:hypothetical protein
MDLCEALIEAEVQLDWGRDCEKLARAVERLKACDPGSALLRPLQLKLVELRIAEELSKPR